MSSGRDPLRHSAPPDREAFASGVRARIAPREGVGAIALREAIDGIVSVEVARVAIAEALAVSTGPFPETIDALRAFARGPLARALRRAGLGDEATEIAARIDRLGPRASRADDEPTARIRLSLRPAAQAPRERVRVVVLATGTAFADALATSRHAERLAVLRVTTEAALTGALHASGPLVVVVDAATQVDDASLASALGGRATPPSVLVTDADGLSGRRILRALARSGVAAIGVAGGGSIDSIAEILVRERAAECR